MADRKKTEGVQQKRESGLPGGGAGRRDDVGRSGVYPMSGPHPQGDAPVVPQASFGQGERGAAGYADSGGSELSYSDANPELCRDIMTKNPVCCAKSDQIQTVAEAMKEQDIGSVPVVENEVNQKLVGMITDRDLVVRLLASRRNPDGVTSEEVMTRQVVSCSPDDVIQTCLDAMESHQIRRVPVVDSAGCVVGIISQGDIAIRLHQPRQTAEVVEEISRPGPG
jgi:CBS domain-containing protein